MSILHAIVRTFRDAAAFWRAVLTSHPTPEQQAFREWLEKPKQPK